MNNENMDDLYMYIDVFTLNSTCKVLKIPLFLQKS